MPTNTTGIATEFIQFTRASNATVTDSDGKVKWAPHNLLTNSESFDAASWTKLNVTIGANSVAAPNGTTTADKIIETTANGLHCPYNNSITGSSGTSYTLSVFAKAAERTWITLILGDGFPATNLARASFNLSTGAVGTVGSAATAYPPVDVGNGWWLCRISATSVGTTFGSYLCTASADDTYSYVGDITKGIYIWGTSFYRSDLGGMQPNTSAYPMYNPTTPKNLLGYTEDFSNAAWVKSEATILANSVIAPNGLQTADKLIETTATGVHLAVQVLTGSTGGSTFSIYAKAAERTILGVGFSSPADCGVYINLSDGSFVSNLGSAPTSYSADPVGNEWYRISVTNTGANVNNPWVLLSNGSPTTARDSYTGDGTSGIYLWGAQLSDSASLDSYSPVYGAAVTSAAYYGPRRDFDPVTLACRGLLVEEQRANLLLHSAAFDNASWIKDSLLAFGSGSTVNATTAPDGTVTADLITSASATAQSGIGQASISFSATAYTWSIYIKPNGVRYVQLLWGSTTSTNYANFDLQSTTYVPTAGTYTAATIAPVSNGFFRITITSTAAAVTGGPFCWFIDSGSAGRAASFTGDGIKGAYVWGAQLEAGSFATSYIPTGAATATRNADVASVSTQAFPYSATEGTVVANFTPVYTSGPLGPYGVFSLHQAAASGSNRIDYRTGGVNIVTVGGADQGMPSAGTPSVNVASKFAVGYKLNDYAAALNSGTVVTDATAAVPPMDAFTIGNLAGSVFLNGHIRQITYLPRRISNTELQTRTT